MTIGGSNASVAPSDGGELHTGRVHASGLIDGWRLGVAPRMFRRLGLNQIGG
jgi:hypothetical protein